MIVKKMEKTTAAVMELVVAYDATIELKHAFTCFTNPDDDTCLVLDARAFNDTDVETLADYIGGHSEAAQCKGSVLFIYAD